MAGPGFGKGGFMRMCTVATTHTFDARAHRCNESGCCFLTASNCRETVSQLHKACFNGNCGNPSGSTSLKICNFHLMLFDANCDRCHSMLAISKVPNVVVDLKSH